MRNEEELLGNKDLREQLKNKVEVLNKVKGLILLPNSDVATTEQVSTYYEVGIEAIKSIVNRNNDELLSDGYKLLSGKEIKVFLESCNQNFTNYKGYFISGGQKFSNRSNGVFTKRAILRVGMLLRDSTVAKEVRSQLLNIVENTSDETKVKEIDEEKKLLFNIAMSDSPEEQMIAVANYRKYMDRYKNKATKWDQFISQEGCHTFTESAKMISTHAEEENIPISITVQKLTKLLREKNILSKNKSHGSFLNLPNKDYEKYFNTTSIDINKNGKEFKKTTTKVEGNGLEFIYDLLKKEYIK